MDLPFVNVLCAQTSAQRSAGPLSAATGSRAAGTGAEDELSSLVLNAPLTPLWCGQTAAAASARAAPSAGRSSRRKSPKSSEPITTPVEADPTAAVATAAAAATAAMPPPVRSDYSRLLDSACMSYIKVASLRKCTHIWVIGVSGRRAGWSGARQTH